MTRSIPEYSQLRAALLAAVPTLAATGTWALTRRSPNRSRLGGVVAAIAVSRTALTVSAPTSSFSVRDQEADVGTIGRPRDVSSLLTRSIQRAGVSGAC